MVYPFDHLPEVIIMCLLLNWFLGVVGTLCDYFHYSIMIIMGMEEGSDVLSIHKL